MDKKEKKDIPFEEEPIKKPSQPLMPEGEDGISADDIDADDVQDSLF